MLAQPAGVAPGELPKAEATELAPEAVGASPPEWLETMRRAFLLGTRSAFGGTSRAEALGIKTRRHFPYLVFASIDIHNGGDGRSKKPFIHALLPPAL